MRWMHATRMCVGFNARTGGRFPFPQPPNPPTPTKTFPFRSSASSSRRGGATSSSSTRGARTSPWPSWGATSTWCVSSVYIHVGQSACLDVGAVGTGLEVTCVCASVLAWLCGLMCWSGRFVVVVVLVVVVFTRHRWVKGPHMVH